MSEIQRYDTVQYEQGAIPAFMPSHDGKFCLYADLLWYRRQYLMALIINVVVVLACGVLAAWLVHEKSARGPVQVPIGAAEKAALLAEGAAKDKVIKDLKAQKSFYEAQIRHKNAAISNKQAQIDIVSPKIDSALAISEHVSQLNREQAQRMSTHQGVVLEAKRVLGVSNVQIVER